MQDAGYNTGLAPVMQVDLRNKKKDIRQKTYDFDPLLPELLCQSHVFYLYS